MLQRRWWYLGCSKGLGGAWKLSCVGRVLTSTDKCCKTAVSKVRKDLFKENVSGSDAEQTVGFGSKLFRQEVRLEQCLNVACSLDSLWEESLSEQCIVSCLEGCI